MARACLDFMELSTVLHRDDTIFFVGPMRNDGSIAADLPTFWCQCFIIGHCRRCAAASYCCNCQFHCDPWRQTGSCEVTGLDSPLASVSYVLGLKAWPF